MRIVDFAHPSWFAKREGSSIWVTAYRMLRVPRESLGTGPKTLDFADARAVLLYGSLNYLDSSEAKIEIITETKWRFAAERIRENETPEGAYLLILVPYEIDGAPGNEPLTREKLSVVTGLLATLNGRNMVFERVFDNIMNMATNESTVFSPTLINPLSFPAPDVADAYLGKISQVDRAIAALPERDSNRMRLALRWFESALFDQGVDSFLKFWIALETLGMPDTTNVRPLVEALCRSYRISYDEAQDRFEIGRLFGLRGRIVHDGEIIPIHQNLIKYVQALFADLLRGHHD